MKFLKLKLILILTVILAAFLLNGCFDTAKDEERVIEWLNNM